MHVVLGALVLGISVSAHAGPNIVLIMADDIGYECLGTYGSASYQTPVLDELARTGIRFDQAHAQPICTPTRVKIMTGQYNYRNYEAFGHLNPKELTFAHLLKEAGYSTCVAGKWQLHGRHEPWVGTGSRPSDAGFDRYCVWQIEERGSRFADPEIETDEGPLTKYLDRYGPDIFTDYILDFMEEKREEPFFVYFPMALVHNPFVPTPDSEEWATDRRQRDNAFFADMVLYMDSIVGRIAGKLDELGLRENTVLLFTGDNGTNVNITSHMRDGRVIQGGKGLPANAGTHVPFIASWPGTAPVGKVCDDLIDFTDFLPTLVELTGATIPAGRVIDGVSFAPQLRGEKGTPREWLFCHYNPMWGNRPMTRFARTVRWKLVDHGPMFDLASDVLETTPLSAENDNEEQRAVRRMLQGVLDSHRPDDVVPTN